MNALARGDDQLMSEVSAGSVDAFAELYDRFCDRAYRVAFSVCRDDARAQDAVQEAFLSVWNSRASYRAEKGTVSAWLLTVVRHRAIDLARRDSHHAAHWAIDDHRHKRPTPDDVNAEIIQRDRADHLRDTLAMLPDEQQEVITLAYYGQLSHTEIAAQLGLPPGIIEGRMRLGLQKLRVGIEQTAA